MSDLQDEIQALRARTGQNLREFLLTELRTCFLSVEMGRFELAQHNIATAKREQQITERGLSTIDRFLPRDPELAAELDSRLKELRNSLAQLAADLGPSEPRT
jgi:hypothetical protein